MSFAPILDFTVGDSASESRATASRAAGLVLRRLAETDAGLLTVLQVVSDASVIGISGQTQALLASKDVEHLVMDVASSTDTPPNILVPLVVEQLQQVLAFAELDGGQLLTSVPAVGGLIRSGRVELFAG